MCQVAVLGQVVRKNLSMEVALGHRADFAYNLLTMKLLMANLEHSKYNNSLCS